MNSDVRTEKSRARRMNASSTRRRFLAHSGAAAIGAASGLATNIGIGSPPTAHEALASRSAGGLVDFSMTAQANTLVDQLPERAIRALEAELSGDVIRPEDANYDQARQVWNSAVDRFPALIVRPNDASDVIQAVNFAREHGLELAVRGGGHSVAGHGTVDGGLVVDLSGMNRLEIDSSGHIVLADAGLTWGEFNAQTHKAGLATPGPDVAAVGLGGLTLGGGFGWLSRKHGMTIDNLLSAEVVSADGQLLTASERENSDLFWALRGGGGNFGIVTRFQFRLHPVRDVVGGVLVYPAARDVLSDYVAAAPTLPDEITTFTLVMLAPPLPFLPSEVHGSPVFMIIPCYTGDPESSQSALAPLCNLGGISPLADTVGPVPYPALFDLTAMGATRQPQAIRAGFMHEIDETALDAILDAVSHASSPYSKVALRGLGGAIGRVPNDATAYSQRDKALYFAINNAWDEEPDRQPERHLAWTEELWRVFAPRTAGAYANFLGDEGPERVRAAYSPESYSRLAALKRQYDPENVFHLNANIAPA
jgi:FAD/FMN-containing dehydrogenase